MTARQALHHPIVDGSTLAAIGTADDASTLKDWYSASDSTDFSLFIINEYATMPPRRPNSHPPLQRN